MKLYSQGLKPVYRVLPNACKTWKRVPGKVNAYLVPLERNEIKAQAANADDDEGGSSAP